MSIEALKFNASINNEEEVEWLSLSNNSGALIENESAEILIEYDFNGFDSGLYETEVNIEFSNNIITVPVSINCNCVSGIKPLYSNIFSVYPNPANDNITVALTDLTNSASMEIYTITGNKLYSTQLKNSKTTFDISDFGINNKGIFLIKITTEDAFGVVKLVVM